MDKFHQSFAEAFNKKLETLFLKFEKSPDLSVDEIENNQNNFIPIEDLDDTLKWCTQRKVISLPRKKQKINNSSLELMGSNDQNISDTGTNSIPDSQCNNIKINHQKSPMNPFVSLQKISKKPHSDSNSCLPENNKRSSNSAVFEPMSTLVNSRKISNCSYCFSKHSSTEAIFFQSSSECQNCQSKSQFDYRQLKPEAFICVNDNGGVLEGSLVHSKDKSQLKLDTLLQLPLFDKQKVAKFVGKKFVSEETKLDVTENIAMNNGIIRNTPEIYNSSSQCQNLKIQDFISQSKITNLPSIIEEVPSILEESDIPHFNNEARKLNANITTNQVSFNKKPIFVESLKQKTKLSSNSLLVDTNLNDSINLVKTNNQNYFTKSGSVKKQKSFKKGVKCGSSRMKIRPEIKLLAADKVKIVNASKRGITSCDSGKILSKCLKDTNQTTSCIDNVFCKNSTVELPQRLKSFKIKQMNYSEISDNDTVPERVTKENNKSSLMWNDDNNTDVIYLTLPKPKIFLCNDESFSDRLTRPRSAIKQHKLPASLNNSSRISISNVTCNENVNEQLKTGINHSLYSSDAVKLKSPKRISSVEDLLDSTSPKNSSSKSTEVKKRTASRFIEAEGPLIEVSRSSNKDSDNLSDASDSSLVIMTKEERLKLLKLRDEHLSNRNKSNNVTTNSQTHDDKGRLEPCETNYVEIRKKRRFESTELDNSLLTYSSSWGSFTKNCVREKDLLQREATCIRNHLKNDIFHHEKKKLKLFHENHISQLQHPLRTNAKRPISIRKAPDQSTDLGNSNLLRHSLLSSKSSIDELSLKNTTCGKTSMTSQENSIKNDSLNPKKFELKRFYGNQSSSLQQSLKIKSFRNQISLRKTLDESSDATFDVQRNSNLLNHFITQSNRSSLEPSLLLTMITR